MLDRVVVQGFKSFDSIDLELGRLSLLVGPNGAGKSNFIQVFELLGEIIRGDLQLSSPSWPRNASPPAASTEAAL